MVLGVHTVDPTVTKPQRRRLCGPAIDAIVDAHANGADVALLAMKYGIHRTIVTLHLRRPVTK